jgi:hypothetical protein
VASLLVREREEGEREGRERERERRGEREERGVCGCVYFVEVSE